MARLSQVRSYIQLIRPIGSVVFGLSVILGEMVACNCIPLLSEMTFGFLTAFFLTGSAFVLNDYVDIEVDKINTPTKPLVTGTVTRRSALYYGVILLFLGLVFPALLSTSLLAFALLTFSTSFFYNIYGKKTGLFGNLIVSFCVSASIVFGALIKRGISNQFVLSISILIFLSNTGREITKGIADAQGDRVKNVKSVALVYGPKNAALLASLFYLLTIISGPFFFQTVKLSHFLIGLTLLAESGFIYSAYTLIKTPSPEQALRVNSQVNVWMILLFVVLLLYKLQTVF